MRVVILSDIHSNLEALQAVLQHAETQGASDGLWCLGDIVGYGPNPNECLELLRRYPLVAIVGNHDWAAAGNPGIEFFNSDAAAACRWTMGELTGEHRRFLRELPQTSVQGDFTLTHGSPREPLWEYLTAPGGANPSFRHFATPYCLVGHTHLPMMFLYDHDQQTCQAYEFPADVPVRLGERRMIINPGSVGQPRNGDPLASYAILDTTAKTITRYRVPYNIATTQEKMRQAGLPTWLWQRLSFGL